MMKSFCKLNTSLLLRTLVMSVTCSFCYSGTVLTLTPENPIGRVGSELNMTCVLDNTQTTYNASQIEWEIYGEPAVNKKEVITKNVALLTLKNLSFVEKEIWIACSLPEHSQIYAAETTLKVGIEPPPPTLHCFSTTVYEYWCDWSHDFTGFKVYYTFQIRESNSWITICPNRKETNLQWQGTRCNVSKEDNPMDTHQVRVTAENSLGNSTSTPMSFNSYEEAIPLAPVINYVKIRETSMEVRWKLQEDCDQCGSLKYELHYLKLHSNQTSPNILTVQRLKSLNITDDWSEYKLNVRSKFLQGAYSEFSLAVIVKVGPLSIYNQTTWNTFILKWKGPDKGTLVYYRISWSSTDMQTSNSTWQTEELKVDFIKINVPCITVPYYINYKFQLDYLVKEGDVMIEGQPSHLEYKFTCQHEDSTTMPTDSFPANASDSTFFVPLLFSVISILAILLCTGFYTIFSRKHIFIEWPEPKYFTVNIETIEPRIFEKETFDELLTKNSNNKTAHSSTSSDQGFHELCPHFSIEEDKSLLHESLNRLHNTNDKPSPEQEDLQNVTEKGTEYFQLKLNGNTDALQLTPLTNASNSNSDTTSYTTMTLMNHHKIQDEDPTSESIYTSDPYCKLHEVQHVTSDDNAFTDSTVFINEVPDDSDGCELIIGEDEMQNLLSVVRTKHVNDSAHISEDEIQRLLNGQI